MRKVLIVDDNPCVLTVLKMMLKPYGFVVLEAESAKGAMRIMSKQSIDVLVTDLYMPEISGFDLIAWAKHRLPDLSVLVVSAGAGQPLNLSESSVLKLADAVLEKPFRADGLIHAIDGLMVA